MFENTRLARKVKFFAVSILAGLLVACGGGSDQGCTNIDPARNPNLPSCTTSGPTVSTAGSTALFTTAPSAITTVSGAEPTYSIGGGTAPYTATSGNTNIVTVGVSGATLTLKGIAGGVAQIAVVDAKGTTVTIKVTVEAKGTGTPPSIFPAAITVGDCTTNIPFIFTGGTAPFTIFTSDNIAIPVSAALPLGADSFFMASIRSLFLSPDSISPTGVLIVNVPREATVTVLDSQSRTATATITIPLAHLTCPDNPLLQTVPASANAHVTEILAFQITGGFTQPASPSYTVQSSNPTIATAVMNSNGTSFNAQAITTGTTLLTVTSADGQKTNITFTVF